MGAHPNSCARYSCLSTREPHFASFSPAQCLALRLKASYIVSDQTHSLGTRVSSTPLTISGRQITQKESHFIVPKGTQKNNSKPKRIKKVPRSAKHLQKLQNYQKVPIEDKHGLKSNTTHVYHNSTA